MASDLIQLGRLGIFLLFIGLGLRVTFARDPGRRRHAIQIFLAYTLGANLLVAAVRTDAWPFSPYPMMAVDARVHDDVRRMVAFKGVDDQGVEWDLDPLSWSPLYPQAVMGWFEVVYPRASAAERREALKFLFERAEQARRALSTGRNFGNRRLLGPFAAPDTFDYGTAPASPRPLSALRIYRVTWRPDQLRRDPGSATWRLFDEYPQR